MLTRCLLILTLLSSSAVGATIPSRLDILGRTYNIIVMKKPIDDGSGVYSGMTNCAPIYSIQLLKRDEKRMAIDLLHEIMHAMTCDDLGQVHNDKFNNKDIEHEGIYYAAPRWYWVLHKNPDLLKFLRDAGPLDVEIDPNWRNHEETDCRNPLIHCSIR